MAKTRDSMVVGTVGKTSDRFSFYTTEKLGPKQSLTPEGFLLCEEVPLARAGLMIYGPDETPIEAGKEGFVKIFRNPEDIFRAETIASAQGKPVTNDHPDDDVTPENWKTLAQGVMLNVRPGTGSMDDLLLGDLLVTTPEGIKAVRDGKVEVSLGYEADYEETGTGEGKQSNILINHIALVDQGRCGPRCAIGDRKTIQLENDEMKTRDAAKGKSKFVDLLRRAFKAKDEAELEDIAKEVGDEMPFNAEGSEGGDTHIHIHNGGGASEETHDDEIGESGRATFTDEDIQAHMDQNAMEHEEMRNRIQALEETLAKLVPVEEEEHGESFDEDKIENAIMDEVPEGLEEQASKAKDSAYLTESFRDTVAMAEILVPGIKIPTFDRAASPKNTFKAICGLRRTALDQAYAASETRQIIHELLGGKTLDTKRMTCDATRAMFRSAAAMRRSMNNSSHRSNTNDGGSVAKPGVVTLADLNSANKKHYDR